MTTPQGRTVVANASLAGGLDLKTDPKSLAPGQTTVCDNAVYTTSGTVRKRYGNTTLNNQVLQGGYLGAPTALSVIGNELLYADQTSVYGLVPELNKWNVKGSTPAFSLTANFLAGSGTYSDPLTNVWYSATAPSGLQFVVSQQADLYGIYDPSTSAWVLPPTALSPIIKSYLFTASGSTYTISNVVDVRVMCYGNYFYLMPYVFGTITSLPSTYAVLSIPVAVTNVSGLTSAWAAGTTFSGVVATPTGSGYSALSRLDSVENGQYAFSILQGVYSSTSTYTFGYFNLAAQGASSTAVSAAGIVPSGFVKSPSSFITQTIPTIAVGALASPNYLVVLNNGSSVFSYEYNISANTLTSKGSLALTFPYQNTTDYPATTNTLTTSAFSTVGTTSGTLYACHLFGYSVINVTTTGAPTLVSANPFQIGETADAVSPMSTPFTFNGGFYIWLTHINNGPTTSTLQPRATYMYDLIAGKTVAIGLNGRSVGIFQYPSGVSGPPAPVNGVVFTLATTEGYVLSNSSKGTVQQFAVVLARLEVDVATSRPVVPLSNGALIGGAYPTYYDGRTLSVAGWDNYPFTPVFESAGSGSLDPTFDQYFYYAVYGRKDSYGNLILSRPSAPLNATGLLGGTQSALTMEVSLPSGANSYVFLYRNSKLQPTVWTQLDGAGAFGSINVTYYTDTQSDASIQGSVELYSDNELENDNPPPFNIGVSALNRVFVVSSEYPNRVYYSKPSYSSGLNNRAPIEFNVASLYIDLSITSSPVTALQQIDSNLIIFKEDGIFVINGNGPDATGNGGSFNGPNQVASDLGCVNPASILRTTDGIYFQSRRGLVLLDRGLSLQYVGAPVEPLFLAGAQVTAATLVQEQSQLRFAVTGAGNYTQLVYDYVQKRWSTFSNLPAAFSTYYNGLYTWALPGAGIITQETPGSFLEAQIDPIVLTITTGWLSPAGMQAWGRLRRVLALGDYKSAHTVTLGFAYDWNSTVAYSVPFVTSQGLQNGDTVYQWRTRSPRQVCQSVQLTLQDSSIIGESYDLTNLLLEFAVKSGAAKMPGQKSL